MKKSIILGLITISAVFIAVGGVLRSSTKDELDLKELAQKRIAIAQREFEYAELSIKSPPRPGEAQSRAAEIDRLAFWSRRWMEAQVDLDDKPMVRSAAIRDHIKRLEKWSRFLEKLAAGEASGFSQSEVDNLEFYVLEAKSALARLPK